MTADTRDTPALGADERWADFCLTVEARIESIREHEGFDGPWEMTPPRPRLKLDPLTMPQRCWDCGAVKQMREFSINAAEWSGRNRRCAACCRIAGRRSYRARKAFRAGLMTPASAQAAR